MSEETGVSRKMTVVTVALLTKHRVLVLELNVDVAGQSVQP